MRSDSIWAACKVLDCARNPKAAVPRKVVCSVGVHSRTTPLLQMRYMTSNTVMGRWSRGREPPDALGIMVT